MGFILHNFYLALNSLIFRLAKFFVQVFGARLLAPAAFGYFSYIYSLIDIWNHVFGAGLDVAASRTYKNQADWPEVWKKASVLKLLFGAAGACAGFLVLDWPYSLLFALWHVFFMQGKLAYTYTNTLLYPKGIVLAGFLAEGGLLAAAYWGVKFWGLPGFVLAFVIERGLESAALWALLRRREPALKNDWKVDGLKGAVKTLLRPAWPIWMSQLLGVLIARLDSVLVANLLGYESLARYSLALRCAEAPLFIFAAMSDSALAYFVRHREERAQVYRRSVRMAALAALGCSAALVIFGLWLADRVFGPQYPGTGALLASYAWVLVPRALNMVSTSRLLAEHKEKELLLSSLAGLGLNLAGNIILLPIVGLQIAPLAAVASEALVFGVRSKLVNEDWILPAFTGLGVTMISALFVF